VTDPLAPEVVTLGETMALLMAEQSGPLREATSFRRMVGGAESNVAVGLCRLGHTAAWISRVGNDDFGRVVLHRLRGEGVDVGHVTVDAGAPTGLMIRERREVGAIEVLYYRRGSAASRLGPADLPEDAIAAARYLYLTGITPALSASCRQAAFRAAEIARGAGVPVVFDPNMRSRLWSDGEARPVLRDLVAHSDTVLPGLAEAELITGESDPRLAAEHLLALGPRLVVLKLGDRGALAATAGGHVVEAPAAPLPRVVDPVGAGDAFAAGLLAATLDGETLPDALALAARCAAHVMSAPGDMENLPFRHELDASRSDPRDVRR
jgi:2-dehydro-3-deoxygluconokinase